MSSPSPLEQITSPATHDRALTLASHLLPNPPVVLIYVTSASNPHCARITPKVEALASDDKYKHKVRFYQMELTPETAPMIKFGIQNTPIFIGYRARWCHTILGPDFRGLVRVLDEQVEKMGEHVGH